MIIIDLFYILRDRNRGGMTLETPIVYIERDPFLIMLLASVETFKRECLGYFFGRCPTKFSNCYFITGVASVQLAKKRHNTSIEQSQLSQRNMGDCFNDYSDLFRVIGDFHSHPEWGSHRREASLSKSDIKDMLRTKYPLAVVIKISSINKGRELWKSIPGKGIKGSLGKYKFHLNVFRIVQSEDGEWDEECLDMQAPGAIKGLNMALGY
jgi:proteasome lid subunit RPN8/RPN11